MEYGMRMSTPGPCQTWMKAPQSAKCDQISSVVACASPMLHRNAKRWRKELGNVAERIGVHLLIECKLSLVAKKSRLNSETVSIPFRHSSALTLAMTRHN